MQMQFAIGLPIAAEIKSLQSCFNNDGLDQWESSVENGERMGLASTFGGASID